MEAQVTTPTPPPPPPGTTHSPGPWRICGPSKTSVYTTIKAADGRTVARIGLRNPQNAPRTDRTDTNNALVISLLPELLAALEDMTALAIKMGNLAGGTDTSADLVTLRKTQALIAKARHL
jgi:hypothetical protein